MLNKKEFQDIKKDLAKFELQREQEIIKSRDIIKLSKLIIYSLHRSNLNDAEKYIAEIKSKVNKLEKSNYDIELSNVARQEYAEAFCYYGFIKNKKIPTRKELNVDTPSYLLGICDLTGELVRKAVDDAIKGNFLQVV